MNNGGDARLLCCQCRPASQPTTLETGRRRRPGDRSVSMYCLCLTPKKHRNAACSPMSTRASFGDVCKTKRTPLTAYLDPERFPQLTQPASSTQILRSVPTRKAIDDFLKKHGALKPPSPNP